MLAHAVLLTTALLLAVAASPGLTHMTLVSGTPQSAHAMAVVGAKTYEATFDKPLVVRVTPSDAKVRFTCITRGCTFPPQVQSENANRVSINAFDVDADSGVASIAFILRTYSVQSVTVRAQAADGHGPSAEFTLAER